MSVIQLPTLHPGQIRAYHTPGLRKAIRCGRRWGKSALAETIACDAAAKRKFVGYFTPSYKFQTEIYADIEDILAPIKKSSSKVEGVIRTTTGGLIDFWTLENERAGRSRKYHVVIIDEAAFGKENATDIWERSIEPTLLDYTGTAWAMSNTNGDDPKNFFRRICKDSKYGFIEYHAPSEDNPYVPARRPGETEIEHEARRAAQFEELKAKKHPLVYQQEYRAEFVDFSGVSFFTRDKLLVNGEPVPYPQHCELVFAVIDTSVKGGKEHDGTAVSYWAYSPRIGIPLICLDWSIIQVDAALLETWMPSVYRRLDELKAACHARVGSTGVWIEDVNSGAVLLQQCLNRNWMAEALPTDLVALGKDGRAINAGDAVHQGLVKFSDVAFHQHMPFKEDDMNHMWQQVTGFRIGDKNAATRSDDLLDTFCYAVAITLGDSRGFG